MEAINLTGKRIGKWTVLKLMPKPRNGQRVHLCRCDCGVERFIPSTALNKGHTSSCRQCFYKDRYNWVHGHARKHGKTTMTYHSWQNMWQRCKNPKATHYHRYGGRGITVCDRWDTFQNFLEDMGERPPGTTLGRINNDLGYFAENCAWQTIKEQQHNIPQNRWVHADGKRIVLSEAARLVHKNVCGLGHKLATHGLLIIDGHFLLPE